MFRLLGEVEEMAVMFWQYYIIKTTTSVTVIENGAYITNNRLCRHFEVLKYFNEKRKDSSLVLHSCCDICSLKCACKSCPVDVHRPIGKGINASTSLCDEGNENLVTRCVTSKERETFVDVLKDMQQYLVQHF